MTSALGLVLSMWEQGAAKIPPLLQSTEQHRKPKCLAEARYSVALVEFWRQSGNLVIESGFGL